MPTRAGSRFLGGSPGDYLLSGIGVVTGPKTAAAIESALHASAGAMAGYDTGRVYANFADRPVDPASLYDAEHYRRERSVPTSTCRADGRQPTHPGHDRRGVTCDKQPVSNHHPIRRSNRP